MDIKFKGGYSRMTGCNMGNHPEYDRGFRNGQQSKQEEVNKLQKEINELKFKMQSVLNTACGLQYSSGERVYEEIKEILK